MSSPRTAVDVVEVIDAAPFLGLPLWITALTILIMLVDGYDLQTMSFVAPAIIADWGIARSELGWVLNGSLIGMAIGSVVLGRLGDGIGRKRAFIACLLSLCAGSLLSAHAHSLAELFADYPRPKTERELENLYPAYFCKQEVPHFMDKDEKAEQ